MASRTRYDEIARQFLQAYMSMMSLGHKERAGLPADAARSEALVTLTTLHASLPDLIEQAKKALTEWDDGHGKT